MSRDVEDRLRAALTAKATAVSEADLRPARVPEAPRTASPSHRARRFLIWSAPILVAAAIVALFVGEALGHAHHSAIDQLHPAPAATPATTVSPSPTPSASPVRPSPTAPATTVPLTPSAAVTTLAPTGAATGAPVSHPPIAFSSLPQPPCPSGYETYGPANPASDMCIPPAYIPADTFSCPPGSYAAMGPVLCLESDDPQVIVAPLRTQ